MSRYTCLCSDVRSNFFVGHNVGAALIAMTFVENELA